MRATKDTIIQSEIDKDKYRVSDAKGGNVPKVQIKGDFPTEDAMFDMIEDTEKYRVSQMVKLMQSESDGKNLNKIIVYLLKSWAFLDLDQCAKVINEANRIIGAKSFDADLRAKMANDLRAFMVAMKRTKGGVVQKTFEEMRKDSGTITVEVPV